MSTLLSFQEQELDDAGWDGVGESGDHGEDACPVIFVDIVVLGAGPEDESSGGDNYNDVVESQHESS